MKTLEQKIQETKNYLNKSEQHLFVVNDKVITKVITLNEDDKLYYAKLEIVPNGYVHLNIYETNTMKWNAKNVLFPQYVKTKSIPYFKQMKELVKQIETEIKTGNGSNKDLIEKIKVLSKDIELIK